MKHKKQCSECKFWGQIGQGGEWGLCMNDKVTDMTWEREFAVFKYDFGCIYHDK